MWLTDLEADRLRNLKAISLRLPAGLTIVAGKNGQGKTSLLESAYLLATGRSFRTRRNDELVSWRGGPLRVAGTVRTRVGPSKLTVNLDSGVRHLAVNGAEQDQESYLGRLDVVDLTAPRMDVLKGAPVERRRFLDRGVVGLRPHYLRALGEYRRVLAQRNALLRRTGPGTDEQLDAWDERLVLSATEVHRERRQYALSLSGVLGEVGRALFSEDRELRLRYRPSPKEAGEADPEKFSEVFAERLSQGRSRDKTIGHTCLGPHRDELAAELDEIDLRKFGSAGQVRAAMIALKVAKLTLLQEDRGEAPLFLMDDFDTDIDELKASSLAEFLQNGGFQALVATSKESLVKQLGVEFTTVKMTDGEAR